MAPQEHGGVVLAALLLATAGCLATPIGGSTATPLPPESVDFPDGPKEAPERPSELTASTVREYVHTYEYRYVYNGLWVSEHTAVTLDCRVDDVTKRDWGFEAVVTCSGSSTTRLPEDSTATPVPHFDYFTQSYRYRVSETTTRRSEAENRAPVG